MYVCHDADRVPVHLVFAAGPDVARVEVDDRDPHVECGECGSQCLKPVARDDHKVRAVSFEAVVCARVVNIEVRARVEAEDLAVELRVHLKPVYQRLQESAFRTVAAEDGDFSHSRLPAAIMLAIASWYG